MNLRTCVHEFLYFKFYLTFPSTKYHCVANYIAIINYVITLCIKKKLIIDLLQGHDTTAAGSSFALCCLGNHPDIQVH